MFMCVYVYECLCKCDIEDRQLRNNTYRKKNF